ncbi:hypothetical protein ACX1C1_24095 [Paenibacillus sp. strain BS8-2]
MFRVLFVFITGQLLLLSIIYNQSVYPIYELNRLGDPSLQTYKVENYTGSTLEKLYGALHEQCIYTGKCNVQLIKTPISTEKNEMTYDVYHSQITKINKFESSSKNKTFSYFQLKQADFADSDGVFYSDIEDSLLRHISNELGISVIPYTVEIEYRQVFQYNLVNFILLVLLTQLIFFIFTFTKIRVNAIKKVLGFSTIRMVAASLKQVMFIKLIVIPILLFSHYIFYFFQNNVIDRYFYLLLVYFIIVSVINLLLMLITQISLRFIDINAMIKNKLYSNKLNVCLFSVKILLILSITVSISIFLVQLSKYKEALQTYDKFSVLENYYTSIGYNSDEMAKATNNKELLYQYGQSIQAMYNHFDELNQIYVHDVSNLLSQLSPFLLERRGATKESILSDFKKNYVVINDTFLKEFLRIKTPSGDDLVLNNTLEPTILVPEKLEKDEKEIRDYFTKRYNALINYNDNYEVKDTNHSFIESIKIVYVANGLKLELFGKGERGELQGTEVTDTILVVDQNKFDSLYYFDELNQGDVIIKAESREYFSQQIQNFNLAELVIEGSLITPFESEIRSKQFIMYHSFIFVLLFLITMIFVVYISNYIDIMSNNKRLALEYVSGFNSFRSLKTRLFVTFILLFAGLFTFFIDFNLLIYYMILLFDVILLMIMYKVIIIRHIQKIIRGGS